jgi:hypothetical protein
VLSSLRKLAGSLDRERADDLVQDVLAEALAAGEELDLEVLARTMTDRALADRAVVIRLLVRRFVCLVPGCGRSTFAEQVPGLTTPHARYTPPLHAALTTIAIALAGALAGRR